MDLPVGGPVRKSRLITWRSIGLGLLIAIVIAVVAPYNDYVVDNSFLVGSYFPPIVTLALMGIVLLVNGPLHRFAPRWALSPGELSVVMAMALVSCSIPSQGLMRQLIPMPVAPFSFTGTDPAYKQLFLNMHLPRWMFAVKSLEHGDSERVVSGFYARLQSAEPIPWSSWLHPAMLWGAFVAAFLTTLMSLAFILRYQWTVNERLAFPIAQLQTMLVAPPARGKMLNDVFRAKGFWIGALLVLTIQSFTVLNAYFPQVVPVIPFRYDLTGVLSEEPWIYLPGWIKSNTIYFTMLGVSYFAATRVSFSLFATAILIALLRWAIDPAHTFLPDAAFVDQATGASFAFLAGILWIGRSHWWMVLRALVGRSRPGDAQGAFVSYRAASIGLILGLGGMLAWLIGVGCTPWLAAAIVLMIVMADVITARVVAETGLAFARVHIPFDTFLKSLPATLITPRDAYLYGVGHYGFMQAAKENTLTFAMHGLNVIDATDDEGARPRRGIASLLGSTLAVTVLACGIASLWCYYRYAIPMTDSPNGMLNVWGLRNWPQTFLVDFPTAVGRGVFPATAYSVWTQVGVGIGIMGVLQALTWRFAGWPFLPVGFLMAQSWYIQSAWFSLFLGWGAKVVILRFGGAKLFNDLKPFFIGLIFGEALATGLWLIVTLMVALSGAEFHVVRFLPQ
ncbi:MAG: DUF6785 family protein [Tepidisphaeraceae bacterium]